MSNPQPSCFGLLLGWVAVAWLGFGVMTIKMLDSEAMVDKIYKDINSTPIMHINYFLIVM